MFEATSCGGVVIFRGKILVLYKNYNNRHEGWVLPKGTMEPHESFEDTAIREIKEESDADVVVRKFIGETSYTFNAGGDTIAKTVHWFLCEANSYNCKPQREEYFYDAGFYKYHEAVHLLKFNNERQILIDAYNCYNKMRKDGNW